MLSKHAAETGGTGSLIPHDGSVLVVATLIFLIRSFPTVCWGYLLTRTLMYSSQSTRAAVLTLLPSRLAQSQLLLRPIHNYVFLPWSVIEALFSLYSTYLAYKIQRPGPKTLYSRRFLHKVFSRALRSGLGTTREEGDRTMQKQQQATSASTNGNDASRLRLRKPAATSTTSNEDIPGDDIGAEGQDPEPWFQAHPLSPEDPRAVKFQAEQAKWFHLPPGADSKKMITRRDSSHWLAWSLFGCTLEELEQEDAEMKGNGAAAKSGPAKRSRSLKTKYITAEDFEGEDSEDPNLHKVLASTKEWQDVDKGTRLDFLRKSRRIIELRQGARYPLRRNGPPGSDEEIAGEGHDGGESTASMRLTLDPVKIQQRPLLAYLVTQGLSTLTLASATFCGGFSLRREGRLSYLIQVPPGWTAAKALDPKTKGLYRPTLFLHGLGIGIAQYSSLVHHLTSSELAKTHPLLIPLQPHTSQNIFSKHFLQPVGHHEMVTALLKVMRQLEWNEVQILSHSMGTIVHSWLLKSLGDKVVRSCFVDPVCFRLFIPDVCGNFVYLPASTSIKMLLRYFVATELGTANTLCRHFDWASNILWPEDEIPNITDPRSTKFFLAGEDAILNCKETRNYLLEFGIEDGTGLRVDWAAAHGELLMKDGKAMEEIVSWLLQLDP